MKSLPIVLLALELAGSGSASPATPLVESPMVHMMQFLSGRLTADGKFQDYSSGTTRGLHIDIQGAKYSDGFELSEDEFFSDGEEQRKVWTFNKAVDGNYIGHRSDLIGVARIREFDDTVELTYTARVQAKSGVYNLNFDDRFVFENASTLTNSVSVSLLMIPVGKAALTIHRAGP